MKKDFAALIKDMRLALREEFKTIVSSGLPIDEASVKLAELEEKQDKMLTEAGYTFTEYNQLMKEHFMDFSSANPDEWIVRYDPDNAQIITGNNLSIK